MLFSDSTPYSPPSSPPSPCSTWVNSSSPPSSPTIEPLCLDAGQEDEHDPTRQTRSNGAVDPLAGSYNANKLANTSSTASCLSHKKRRVELQSRATELDNVEISKGEDKKYAEKVEWDGAGVRVFETGNGEIDLMYVSSLSRHTQRLKTACYLSSGIGS